MIVIGRAPIEHPRWVATRAYLRWLYHDERTADQLVAVAMREAGVPWR